MNGSTTAGDCLFASLQHIIIHTTCQQTSRWLMLTSSTPGCSSLGTTTDSAWHVFAQMLPKRVRSVCTPIWTSFHVSTHYNCHDKDLTMKSGNSCLSELEASFLPLPEGYFEPDVVVMSWHSNRSLSRLPPVESQCRVSGVHQSALNCWRHTGQGKSTDKLI